MTTTMGWDESADWVGWTENITKLMCGSDQLTDETSAVIYAQDLIKSVVSCCKHPSLTPACITINFHLQRCNWIVKIVRYEI